MTLQQSPLSPPASRSRWIPWVFVAAMGLVVVVNGALVYFALGSRSAVVGKSPYEEGRHYARTLARRDAQARQQWHVAVGYVGDLTGGRIEADVRDGAGQPIDGAQVLARISRPVGHLPPQLVKLEPHGRGRYAAGYTMVAAGQWDLAIEVDGVGVGFASQTRIVVK